MYCENAVLKSQVVQGKLFLSWSGEVSHHNVEILYKPIADSATDYLVTSVEIDMRDVNFIDSSGLQILVAARRAYSGRGALRIRVTEGSQPDPVIRLAKLDLVLGVTAEPRKPA